MSSKVSNKMILNRTNPKVLHVRINELLRKRSYELRKLFVNLNNSKKAYIDCYRDPSVDKSSEPAIINYHFKIISFRSKINYFLKSVKFYMGDIRYYITSNRYIYEYHIDKDMISNRNKEMYDNKIISSVIEKVSRIKKETQNIYNETELAKDACRLPLVGHKEKPFNIKQYEWYVLNKYHDAMKSYYKACDNLWNTVIKEIT